MTVHDGACLAADLRLGTVRDDCARTLSAAAEQPKPPLMAAGVLRSWRLLGSAVRPRLLKRTTDELLSRSLLAADLPSAPKQMRAPAAKAPGTFPPAIVRAIRFGQLHVVGAWLDGAFGSIDDTDGAGSSALHYAVLVPGTAAVDMLVKRGIALNTRLPNGCTPLLVATLKANHHAVVRLLEAGADPNIADTDGHTPLMVAARSGWAETVQALCDNGARLGMKDAQNRTALWYAKKYEQKGTAMVLRKARGMQQGAQGA